MEIIVDLSMRKLNDHVLNKPHIHTHIHHTPK